MWDELQDKLSLNIYFGLLLDGSHKQKLNHKSVSDELSIVSRGSWS